MLRHPLLRPVFITQFMFGTAWFLHARGVRSLRGAPSRAVGGRHRHHAGDYGVGMVVGALLATRVMRRLPFGTVIGLGPVTGFVAAAVIALTTVIPSRCWRAWASSCSAPDQSCG